MKKLIVFDLDGTLTESKASLDDEMASLLQGLISLVKVCIISGGDWPQFEKQVLARLPQGTRLSNLALMPNCGTKFYIYKNGWKKIYSEDLTLQEKAKILRSLDKAIADVDLKKQKLWGVQIEDRGSQITFSALGQEAPLKEKKKWDDDMSKRRKIKSLLEKSIPEFSVRIGGSTSIDITKPGIDKAYGIHKLHENLGITLRQMVFIGNAIFPGGNDYPVQQVGVLSISVEGPSKTKQVVSAIIDFFSGTKQTNAPVDSNN